MARFHNFIAELIVTIGYIGKSKYFPGTLGSLVAYPLCYFCIGTHLPYNILANFKLSEYELFILPILFTLIISILLFFIGLFFVHIYLKSTNQQDPAEVVIDEVVGQMLSLTLCFPAMFLPRFVDSLPQLLTYSGYQYLVIIMPFMLFRLFDIVKPWPINWIDKNVKGAFGVMIDDVVAAIFASVTFYTILFVWTDLFYS